MFCWFWLLLLNIQSCKKNEPQTYEHLNLHHSLNMTFMNSEVLVQTFPKQCSPFQNPTPLDFYLMNPPKELYKCQQGCFDFTDRSFKSQSCNITFKKISWLMAIMDNSKYDCHNQKPSFIRNNFLKKKMEAFHELKLLT